MIKCNKNIIKGSEKINNQSDILADKKATKEGIKKEVERRKSFDRNCVANHHSSFVIVSLKYNCEQFWAE
jgi:hypothetical protein